MTTPILGEIRKACEIGRKGSSKWIFFACPNCGKERWVSYQVKSARPISLRCHSCASSTRNGEFRQGNHNNVYTKFKLAPEDEFFRPTAKKDGWIYEHRLVMAKYLGRNLHPWELVHHKNDIKCDNQIDNLRLVTRDFHNAKGFKTNEVRVLETEIQRLRKQIKQLTYSAA